MESATELSSLDFSTLSDSLVRQSDGIWTVISEKTDQIDYPDTHHDELLEVQATSFWYQHRKNCISALIKQFSIAQILDVGGSNGLLSADIGRHAHVTLLEPSSSGVRNAKEIGLTNIIRGTLIQAEFKDEVWPAVGLFDVLEHVRDEMELIHEIYRITSDQGKIIVTVPAYQYLWSKFDEEVGHHRRYTIRSLQNLLEKAGFNVEYKTYLFWFLPFVIFVMRRLLHTKIRGPQGHIPQHSIVGGLIKRMLQIEGLAIQRKIKIPFGSSVMIIASKCIQND